MTLLDTGEIVATHGIRGEIKILPWADSPDFLLEFSTFYIGGKPYRVEQARVQKTCVLAKLSGIDTVEQASALRGKPVQIEKEAAPLPEGAVFIADLIGCTAVDEDGIPFGEIRDVLTMPSSDVYVIRGEREYMVPAVKAFVKEIDLNARRVKIARIEGMATDEN